MSRPAGRAQKPDRGGTQVGPGTVVAVSYELYDAEGDLLDASHPALPLIFVFGYGQVPPPVERALDGLVAGQARRVRLDSSEAFGPRDPQAIVEVAREELPVDLQVGDFVDAETEDGRVPVVLRVLELEDGLAVLDANHPLAGQTVEVDIVVDSVRVATSTELEDAEAMLQAQGPDGMQTLIPAARLLKRGGGGKTQNGPSHD